MPKRSIDTVLGKGMIGAVLEPVFLPAKAVAIPGGSVLQTDRVEKGNERKGLIG